MKKERASKIATNNKINIRNNIIKKGIFMKDKRKIIVIVCTVIIVCACVFAAFSVHKRNQSLEESSTTSTTAISTTSPTETTKNKTTTIKQVVTTTTEIETEYEEEYYEDKEEYYEEDEEYYDEEEYEEEYYDEEEYDSEDGVVSLGTFKLTAYCNCEICCGVWAGGATASGVMPVANHTIAVDTDVIPFGTKLIINGNTYVAEDTGSAIIGNRIDVYFDSHSDALDFGVQYAEVFMVN